MTSFFEELNQNPSCSDEKESLDAAMFPREEKKEASILDITQQQWFWDQAVWS